MIATLIIFGVFIIAAFYSGFYFGYTKREGKPPEAMPIVSDVKEVLDKAMEPKKPDKPTKEEQKANSFFN
jgi:hypothetical protein